MNHSIEKQYDFAREQYAEHGIDTDSILDILNSVSFSIPCWQADDVTGLESWKTNEIGGGLAVTGNYPGRARDLAEMQQDLNRALTLIPGKHRVNLHAMYGDFQGKRIDRNEIDIHHFTGWLAWAEKHAVSLDFNSTYFAHPKADSGFTLSHKDHVVRQFWIDHGIQCRKIAAEMGRVQGNPCMHNTWIPDGCKDHVPDKWVYRELLNDSLNQIFKTDYPDKALKDSVESKLFGIGSESFVVGSYDFYLGYALRNNKLICLDMGHFHPTESIADKLTAVLQFFDQLLLHITRSVRWDSDHVPVLNDPLQELMHEVISNGLLDRIILALDFFDASINRIAAYVLGVRAAQQALLKALLRPDLSLADENQNRRHIQLAMTEFYKTLPFGAVWDFHCLKNNVPPGSRWLQDITVYENEILSLRTE